MSRVTINYDDPDWQPRLQLNLSQRNEVDLINVDFLTHGKYLESLAQSFSMEILPSREPSFNLVYFRKPIAGKSERNPGLE